MNYQIRLIHPSEVPLLKDFLYEAIFIPEGAVAPPRNILDDDSLQVYIRDFGKSSDNYCLVAEADDKVVGAIWIMMEGVILAINAFDYKKAGFNGWWFICLLGIGAVILGYFGLRNPIATGKTISVLIGLAIILGGCARIIGLIGINKFEKFLKGI